MSGYGGLLYLTYAPDAPTAVPTATSSESEADALPSESLPAEEPDSSSHQGSMHEPFRPNLNQRPLSPDSSQHAGHAMPAEPSSPSAQQGPMQRPLCGVIMSGARGLGLLPPPARQASPPWQGRMHEALQHQPLADISVSHSPLDPASSPLAPHPDPSINSGSAAGLPCISDPPTQR